MNTMITMITQTIVAVTCPECGVAYGLSAEFIRNRRDDHQTWHCPNKHSLWYSQDNEAEQLRKQLSETEQSLKWARSREEAQRRERRAAERSAAAYKGHVTKLRNRISNGVCPVQGCQRSFTDVRRHITSKHPEWAHEHPEALVKDQAQ